MSRYDWSTGLFQKRCKARLNEKFLIYKGRCDLKRDHTGPHALERGMEVIEFKVTYERKLSEVGELVVRREIRNRQMRSGNE